MTVQVYTWSCSSTRPGYYSDPSATHDGLSFVWDGIEDPFQPETLTFGKLLRDGWIQATDRLGPNMHRLGVSQCRCMSGSLGMHRRDATPEEIASYQAAKRVRVPASMMAAAPATEVTGVMTGAMQEIPAWARPTPNYNEQLKSQPIESIAMLTELTRHSEALAKVVTESFALLKDQIDNAARREEARISDMRMERDRREERLVTEIKVQKDHIEYLLTRPTEMTMGQRENAEVEGQLAVPAKKGLLSKIKDSTVAKAVTDETKEASWRGAAWATVDLAKQAIAKAKPFIPKQYQRFHPELVKFIETPLGKAALMYGVGVLLSAPFMPGAGQGKQKRLASELRVGATAEAGYSFVKPFVGFLSSVALGGFATIMESVPDVEDEAGVRVEAASGQTMASEGDESDSRAINEHNANVKAKRASK